MSDKPANSGPAKGVTNFLIQDQASREMVEPRPNMGAFPDLVHYDISNDNGRLALNPWNGRCHRCNEPSIICIMSMFSAELICGDCKDKERRRPDYAQAVDQDLREFADRAEAGGLTRVAAAVRRIVDNPAGE